MPEQLPDDVPDEQRYPRIAAWYEQQERSTWELVDALLAEARMNPARRGYLADGEMDRISRFIERGGRASETTYTPKYLGGLHKAGRWAEGRPEIRDYPVGWARACQSAGVPVTDALPLMARNRQESPPPGTKREHHLLALIAQWKTPSLDARRDGDAPVPPPVAQYRRFKIAERAATNLGQLVKWAEQADPDELVVFAEQARALVAQLEARLSILDQPAKTKRRRKATTA